MSAVSDASSRISGQFEFTDVISPSIAIKPEERPRYVLALHQNVARRASAGIDQPELGALPTIPPDGTEEQTPEPQHRKNADMYVCWKESSE